MGAKLSDDALDTIFRSARSYNGYTDAPVTEADLHAIWDLMKFGPTSVNMLPARLVWCTTPGGYWLTCRGPNFPRLSGDDTPPVARKPSSGSGECTTSWRMRDSMRRSCRSWATWSRRWSSLRYRGAWPGSLNPRR